MDIHGNEIGFPIYHHPLQAEALARDRKFREKEYNRDDPYYLPVYTEVWSKAPKRRRNIYQQFLRSPIIYQGVQAEERWKDAAEDVHELDRDLWATAVMTRSDTFFGEYRGGFVRQRQLEGELGYAALAIPFAFDQLSGFFEFVYNYLELLTLTENWLAPRRIDKPDVWQLDRNKKAAPFPASHCAIRPRNDNDARGRPQLLELVAGHACNFRIEFGPHLQEVQPIHKRSGLSVSAVAKRVVISVTMNEGSLAWAALGPRIVLAEAPMPLIEYVARILTDPIKGIGHAWYQLDGREQEAFLTRPMYYPLPTFNTGPDEKSSDDLHEDIRRGWKQRKLGQSFELGDGPWNSPWPHESPGDNVPEPVVINGKEYRPIRVSARPLTTAVDFTKLRPSNWGLEYKDEKGRMRACFPLDKRMRLRGSILDCHKAGAAELYDNSLASKWDRVDTGPAHASGKYAKAGRIPRQAKPPDPRPAPAPQRRLTPPASSISATAALNPVTAPRSAGSSSRHRTAMPTTHHQQEARQEQWQQRRQAQADDWGIPPDELPAPVVPTPPTHSATFPVPSPRETFDEEARARHLPVQEQARQQADAVEEEKQKAALRQKQAEEQAAQAEQARAEAAAREEQEREEFQTLCREIHGARERHDATDTRSEVSVTSSSTAWRELDRALERTYQKETFRWQLVSFTFHERAKAQHIRLIHRAAKYHHQQWLDTLLFRCGKCATRQPADHHFCVSCGSPNPRFAVDQPPQPLGTADATPPTQPAVHNVDPPPTQSDANNDDPPLAQAATDRAQVMNDFIRTGFYTAPDPIPAVQLLPMGGDLAADQIAGIYETPQLRPAQTPFTTPDPLQPSGLFPSDPEAEARINQFAAQLAEAIQTPLLPELTAQQPPASSSTDRKSHFTRLEEREDRGEWPEPGAQQAQWQARWNAAQATANTQSAPLSLDELAQEKANRLWRVQEDQPRPQRTFADLPAPADALPHFQPPIPAPQQDAPDEEDPAVFLEGPHESWQDASPMTLEERLSAATSYGGRFYVCFSCVDLCQECGNNLGHKQFCSQNDPAKHGRTSHSQLYWLRAEGLFVWPYSDSDWKEFLPDTKTIRDAMAHLPTRRGVHWRNDVWRRVGKHCRQGGYVVDPHLLRDAIHQDDPPFAIHCSGLSGRTPGREGTTPTLQMNGRPSFQQWYVSYCVSWNQLNKSWSEFCQFQDGATHLCPCPKPRGTCRNEERCNYVWCDRWDTGRVVCPTAVWHRAHEATFLF